MTNNTLPKNRPPQPDRSPNWYNIFLTHLTSGPSRTLEPAFLSSTNSKSTPSPTSGKQAVKWRWEKRAMAYDRAYPQDTTTGANQPL